jgi:Pregnancy-associated plasma protein-A
MINMKKCIHMLICLTVFADTYGQTPQLPHRFAKCNTRASDTGYYMRNAAQFLANRLAQRGIYPDLDNFTAPYNVRVFIRIVRQDNGTLPGCTRAEALQNFEEMKVQYSPHNICFQLLGIDFVDDTYLNNFNVKANLEDVYPAYIRNNNLDVNGAITIFIHYNFLNDTSSSGNAYGIPNNFLSVARWAATSTDVHSIFGHEMGHCLGLYHTFENNLGQENVTRNSASSCYDCDADGDLCCDTPADYEDSQDNTSSTTCNYSGTRRDLCSNLLFDPSTINIMSYQPWTCISTSSSAITANQRTRMHAGIVNPLGPLFTRVAEDNLALTTVSASSNAVRVYSAKNNVTTGSGASVSHTGSSQAYYAAGTSITFSPGVLLSPGAAGQMQASISGCN